MREQDAGEACIPAGVLREHEPRTDYNGAIEGCEAAGCAWRPLDTDDRTSWEMYIDYLGALAPAQDTAEGPLTAWERRFRAQERESEHAAGALPAAVVALLRKHADDLRAWAVIMDRRSAMGRNLLDSATSLDALLAGQPDAEVAQ